MEGKGSSHQLSIYPWMVQSISIEDEVHGSVNLSGCQVSELNTGATQHNKTFPFQCIFYTDTRHKQTSRD